MPVIEGLTIAPMGKQASHVLATNIDQPLNGAAIDGYSITVEGWTLGKGNPVEAVQAVADNRVVAVAPVNLPTPHIAERFAAAGEWRAHAGFRFTLDALGLEPTFEVRLRAIVKGNPVARIGAIRGRRAPLVPAYSPRLQSLLVTSIGRTGSTLLMRLLAAHPAIVAYRRPPFEARAAKYWLHLLKTLARPVDPVKRTGHPNEFHLEPIAAGNPFATPEFDAYPNARDWSNTAYLESLAGFCLQSIDGWYDQVATAQGQDRPAFWVEKSFPDDYATLARELYPAGREIVLVRDFRDMWASMRAYNERLGFGDFGQHRARSDFDWLEELRAAAMQLYERARTRSRPAILVRYEDLVREPAATIGPLFATLGLDDSPAVVDTVVTAMQQEEAGFIAHRTSDGVDASIGRWRRDLTPEQQELARDAFDDILPTFGYAVD